ncbi:glyoxalase-like domain-containing protein [Schizophyllum fasciatum]
MTTTFPTNTLDHIVHLAPNVKDATESLTKLGFNVLPGGTHADGLTENALIAFPDGTYIELISFTHAPDYYPPGTPERAARDAHRWARRPPGWADYGFLGNGALAPPDRVSDLVNARAAARGAPAPYAAEVPGGRTRPDGVRLEWAITAGRDPALLGLLPFFCGDVTDRGLRVPSSANDTAHPVGASGVSAVRVLVQEGTLDERKAQLADVVGEEPVKVTDRAVYFPLRKPTEGKVAASLILSVPEDEEEREFVKTHGSTLYEVQVRVSGGKSGSVKTPFARIKWESA